MQPLHSESQSFYRGNFVSELDIPCFEQAFNTDSLKKFFQEQDTRTNTPFTTYTETPFDDFLVTGSDSRSIFDSPPRILSQLPSDKCYMPHISLALDVNSDNILMRNSNSLDLTLHDNEDIAPPSAHVKIAKGIFLGIEDKLGLLNTARMAMNLAAKIPLNAKLFTEDVKLPEKSDMFGPNALHMFPSTIIAPILNHKESIGSTLAKKLNKKPVFTILRGAAPSQAGKTKEKEPVKVTLPAPIPAPQRKKSDASASKKTSPSDEQVALKATKKKSAKKASEDSTAAPTTTKKSEKNSAKRPFEEREKDKEPSKNNKQVKLA